MPLPFARRARRPRSLSVQSLEDREVPAVYYVDPVGFASGTFNAGRPDQVAGLTPGVNLFADFNTAVAAANANPGTDTVALSYTADDPGGGSIFVNTAVNTPLQITNSLNVVGSLGGAGASTLTPANDQATGPVLLVTGAGVAVNFTGVTFFGGGIGFDGATGDIPPTNGNQILSYIDYGPQTTGRIDASTFSGIFANGFNGTAVRADNATLTVSNTAFGLIGSTGVSAANGASITLLGNTYTGKGSGPYFDYFAKVTGGSSAVLSGNRVTNNTGSAVAGVPSAAVVVDGNSNAAVFGNQFFGNTVGLLIGNGASDTSNAQIHYNNIFGNALGVSTNRLSGATPVDARNNFWGYATGPFNSQNNPTGQGNDVSNDVLFAPALGAAAPVLAAPDLGAYLAAAFPPPPPAPPAPPDPPPAPPEVFLGRPFVAVGSYTGATSFLGYNPNNSSAPFSVAVPAAGAQSRTTLGDVTGDGVPDLIQVSGPGSAATVTVYDGATGASISSFGVLLGFTGGAYVAAGDFNGDGRAEVVVAADAGGGPVVEIYDLRTLAPQLLANFFVFAPDSRFGTHLAVGDINNDGVPDLITTPGGAGAGGVVSFFNGKTVLTSQSKLIPDQLLSDPNQRNGLFLSVGDINGDGFADVGVSFAPGGPVDVNIFSGLGLTNGNVSLLTTVNDGPATQTTGLTTVLRDVTGDGLADLITGDGFGGRSEVRVFFNDGSGLFPTFPNRRIDDYGTPGSGVYVG